MECMCSGQTRTHARAHLCVMRSGQRKQHGGADLVAIDDPLAGSHRLVREHTGPLLLEVRPVARHLHLEQVQQAGSA